MTHAPAAARGRADPRWVLPVVGVVALVARLAPVLTAGMLRGVHGYDDGVHLAVAQRLIAGIVPYRDEVFLHPPGIAVALAPFAAVAEALGDSWSLALARLAFIVLGAVNAMLVARILTSRGALAAAVGGGAYALWGAAVAAEHTVYLETPIGLGLLIALGALRRAGTGPAGSGSTGSGSAATASSGAGSRSVALAGLAIGVAVTFKVWVAIDAVVIAALVLARGGSRALGRWCAWVVLGAAPVLAPFVALAPAPLWHGVVVVQGARPVQGKDLAGRLGALDPTAALHPPFTAPVALVVALVLLAAVLAPLVVAVRQRLRPAAWADPVWWGALAALQLLALAAAPSFYRHYAAFVAPALCLLLGAGAERGVAAARAHGGRSARVGPAVAVAVAVTAGLALALARPPLPTGGRVDNAVLADFAARHECVWVRNPSYLQLADAAARQLRAGCPSTPDLVGAWLVLEGGGTVPGTAASDLDELVLAELRAADGALLAARRPTQDLGPRARAYLADNFSSAGRTGAVEMWSRTP